MCGWRWRGVGGYVGVMVARRRSGRYHSDSVTEPSLTLGPALAGRPRLFFLAVREGADAGCHGQGGNARCHFDRRPPQRGGASEMCASDRAWERLARWADGRMKWKGEVLRGVTGLPGPTRSQVPRRSLEERLGLRPGWCWACTWQGRARGADRTDCVRKLRSVQVSDHFQAILGCLLGEDWTTAAPRSRSASRGGISARLPALFHQVQGTTRR